MTEPRKKVGHQCPTFFTLLFYGWDARSEAPRRNCPLGPPLSSQTTGGVDMDFTREPNGNANSFRTETSTRSEGTYYYLTDAIGSVKAVVNEQGEKANPYLYASGDPTTIIDPSGLWGVPGWVKKTGSAIKSAGSAIKDVGSRFMNSHVGFCVSFAAGVIGGGVTLASVPATGGASSTVAIGALASIGGFVGSMAQGCWTMPGRLKAA